MKELETEIFKQSRRAERWKQSMIAFIFMGNFYLIVKRDGIWELDK